MVQGEHLQGQQEATARLEQDTASFLQACEIGQNGSHVGIGVVRGDRGLQKALEEDSPAATSAVRAP